MIREIENVVESLVWLVIKNHGKINQKFIHAEVVEVVFQLKDVASKLRDDVFVHPGETRRQSNISVLRIIHDTACTGDRLCYLDELAKLREVSARVYDAIYDVERYFKYDEVGMIERYSCGSFYNEVNRRLIDCRLR